MGKYNFSFLLMNIIILIVFIGLTFIVFDLHRFFFIGELAILGILLLSAIIGMAAVYYDKSWGWIWLSVASLLALADLLLVYVITKNKGFALLPTAVASALALIVSLFNLGGKNSEEAAKAEIEAPEKAEPLKKAARRGRRK